MPAVPKPAKGSSLLARHARRKALRAQEQREKEAVRKRDVRCRWPSCPDCATTKTRLEVAHLRAKGMGGDHGARSERSHMILLCFLRHQGPRSLHSGDLRIEPLTERGTDGPCRFLELRESGWSVVHVEDER